MSDAPFVEKAVPADAQVEATRREDSHRDEKAKAARQRLQAVLDELNPAAGKASSDEPKAGKAGKGGKAGKKQKKMRQAGKAAFGGASPQPRT